MAEARPESRTSVGFVRDFIIKCRLCAMPVNLAQDKRLKSTLRRFWMQEMVWPWQTVLLAILCTIVCCLFDCFLCMDCFSTTTATRNSLTALMPRLKDGSDGSENIFVRLCGCGSTRVSSIRSVQGMIEEGEVYVEELRKHLQAVRLEELFLPLVSEARLVVVGLLPLLAFPWATCIAGAPVFLDFLWYGQRSWSSRC